MRFTFVFNDLKSDKTYATLKIPEKKTSRFFFWGGGGGGAGGRWTIFVFMVKKVSNG